MSDVKYIAYYRVSTKRQGESGLGLEAQRAVIEFFTRNDEIIAEFTEVGSGGALEKRIKLREAVELAKQTKAFLIVAKTDRFRNVVDALNICDELESARTKLICCDVPNTDRFTLTLFFAFAERERLMISIRTKAALQAKKVREGKEIINGAAFHKTKVSTEKARKKSAEVRSEAVSIRHQKVIVLIKQLRQDGYTLQKIANSLNNIGYKTSRNCDFKPFHIFKLLQR